MTNILVAYFTWDKAQTTEHFVIGHYNKKFSIYSIYLYRIDPSHEFGMPSTQHPNLKGIETCNTTLKVWLRVF